MLRKLLLVKTVLLCMASPAFAAGPYGKIIVGNWSGGAFTNDRTGEFSGCIVTGNYKSGITMGVMVSPRMTWQLAFTHNEWRLTPGSSFPIALTFDGQPPFNVNGRPSSGTMVLVDMPDNSALIQQFRKSKVMTAYAQGQLFQFRLDNTSVMLPALVNCVNTVKREGLAGARDFVLASKPKPLAQPSAPQVGTSLRPEPQPNLPPELQFEAIELATNFILKTSLKNARVLSRSETPVTLASAGAAWKADEVTGFVRIVPPSENLKGLEVAAAVAGNDAKDCKAKFLSARTTELVDSEVVFRGISSCEDSEGKRTAHYFVVPRRKGGFVLFSVLSTEQFGRGFNEPTNEARNEARLADFKKAALVVAGN